MTVEFKEATEPLHIVRFGTGGRYETADAVSKFLREQRYADAQIQTLVDALPAIFIAVSRHHLLSGPEVTFHKELPGFITFGFYIGGHHPSIGRTLNGLTGNETFVRYSIFHH